MPVAVRCPSCSASFNVKDEYAGKRTKCPKCGGPLTIPTIDIADTVKMPYPPAAPRPKQPATPQPASEEPEEKPRKKRVPDDEDAPRSKKRPRDEDEEDDRPKRRSHGGGGKSKKSSLPMVLGILAGVLLLGGGGCAGVWFGYLKPAAEQAKKRNDEKQAELDRLQKQFEEPPQKAATGEVSRQSARQVKPGMTQVQVDAVLGGPGTSGNKFITDEVMAAIRGGTPKLAERWHKATMEGRVYVWEKGRDKVLVGYNTQPGLVGGTVVAVIGLFDGSASELIPLPSDG
jgi:predicted Zn finger-like uncharacterized protein